MLKITLLFAIALVFVVAFSSYGVEAQKFTFPWTAPTNTCSITKGCAKSGDACVGNLGDKACNVSSANATCCGSGLLCVNKTCFSDNVGEYCKNVSDCFGGGDYVKCLNSTCTQLGLPGDGCTDDSSCYYATSKCNNDSICTGVSKGGMCLVDPYVCDVGLYCAKDSSCQPQLAAKANCSVTLASYQQVCANGLICGSNKTCITPFSGNNGTTCGSSAECAQDYACDFKTFKCSTANEWAKVDCNSNSDCTSEEYCACSVVTGEQICVPLPTYLDDSCSENSQDFLTCVSANNCSSYYFYAADMNVLPDDSCVAQNCKSDTKKAYSCGCTFSKDSLGDCAYSPYCGGFPLWAIIVIAIVGVILVLVIIIVIVMVMRRRRTYDTIA